nr:WD40 repeat domain-containing protein [Candidatus Wallbacteria bacterium]
NRIPEGVAGRDFLFLIARFLRFDFDFLRSHPDRFFQCAWNRCWWHDNPEAEKHYQMLPGGWTADNAPWKRPGDKICRLLEKWREIYENRENTSWLRAMTPPAVPLNGRLACSLDFGKRRGVSFACAHPAAGRLVVLDGGGVISVWDIDRSVAVENINEDDISSDSFDFGGADDYEVLGYIKNDYREKLTRILLWSPGAGLRIYRYASPAVILSKRLGRLFSAQENKIYSLDLASGDNNFLCEMHGENKFIYCMAVDEENGRIITGANDDRVCGYDLNACEKYFETPFASSLAQILICPGTSDFITLHDDRSFYLWNARFGKAIREFAGHRKFVTGAVVDRVRGRILSSSNDGTVREWNIAGLLGASAGEDSGAAATARAAEGGGGGESRVAVSDPGAFQSLALLDDGRKIITVSEYSIVSVWFDMPSVAPAGPVLKKRAAINSAARSGDGKSYFTRHDDDSLVFWNAKTGAAECEIDAPVTGPLVRMSVSGPDSLIIEGFENAGIRSITLVNTRERSVVFSRRFDEKFSEYTFDSVHNVFYIIREDCLCVFDLAKNDIEEVFKLEYRSPSGRAGKIIAAEPKGRDGSSFTNLMYFKVPSPIPAGHSEKFFIFDTLAKKVSFEYCRPGYIISETTIICEHEILYFYTVKQPELKWFEPPFGAAAGERAMPLLNTEHFTETYTNAAKEFEFNFMRLSDHKNAKFPLTARFTQSCLLREGLMIVMGHVGPQAYKPVEGEKFEAVVFDLVNLAERMRLNLPAPLIEYNTDCPGYLLMSLAGGSLGVLPTADLKLSTAKIFDNYISEMIYIAENLFLLTDSKGRRQLFDVKKMSAVDCGEYIAGDRNIIIENDGGGLEMLTCRRGFFRRLRLTDPLGLQSEVSVQAVPGDVTDMAFVTGRYCCVLDGRTLRISDAAENRVETIDLMDAVISAAGEDNISSTGAARTLFSNSGRYLMYFLNYKMNISGRCERQAMLLYDLERGCHEVKCGLYLDGDYAPGILKPFHISAEKRIYFMRNDADDDLIGSGFFFYDFERNLVGEIDFNFLFDYDFTSLAVDDRGVYLAAARPYGQILITDLREGDKYLHDFELNEHYYPITSLYFTRDGKYLITRSLDGMTVKWRTGSWEKVETIVDPFPIFEFTPNHKDDPRRRNYPERPDYLCFAAAGDEALHYNMRSVLDPNAVEFIDRPDGGDLIVIADKDKLRFISVEKKKKE